MCWETGNIHIDFLNGEFFTYIKNLSAALFFFFNFVLYDEDAQHARGIMMGNTVYCRWHIASTSYFVHFIVTTVAYILVCVCAGAFEACVCMYVFVFYSRLLHLEQHAKSWRLTSPVTIKVSLLQTGSHIPFPCDPILEYTRQRVGYL